MSIDEAEISRRNILRLVRKSASTDCNDESLRGSATYPEHRIKFLERRKQFEEPPCPVDNKPPFLPHWIKPEYDAADLSITYKKKGAEITDLRINYVHNNDGNSKEIGIKERPRALEILNKNSVDGRFDEASRSYAQNVNVNFRETAKEDNSVDTSATDENWLGISCESVKRPMDRRGKSTKSIRRTQSLRSIEERSSPMSSKTVVTLDSNRTFDTSRKNQGIITNYTVPRTLIVCSPIVRRPIELKKYDHIVTNVIGTKR